MKAALSGAVLLALAGCGPGESRPVLMAPPMQGVVARHAGTVAVSATGGCDDCAAGQARLSAAQLRDAAVMTLSASGLFAAVVAQPPVEYELALRIFSAHIPMMGFDMRCTAELGWTLTRQGKVDPIWQQAIQTQYTATVGDAFAGVERVRLCWEGAVRNNLAEGIGRLSGLPLPAR